MMFLKLYRIYNAIIKQEALAGYKKACLDEQFLIRWRQGDLTIKYLENDIEVDVQVQMNNYLKINQSLSGRHLIGAALIYLYFTYHFTLGYGRTFRLL